MAAKKFSSKSAPSAPPSHAAVLPIKRIDVVGCGGNGSIFISHLCRIYQAWVKLGGSPFQIHLHDPDVVSEANLARQCFCEADIGQPKAFVLAQRMRAFFGIEMRVHVNQYSAGYYGESPSMVVGCADNLKARHAMAATAISKPAWANRNEVEKKGCYWLDLGNSDNSGQVVLGGHGLKTLFDLYPHLEEAKDPKEIPSCSMAESLARQDLFINSTIATLAGHLLWRLMRNGGLNHHGYVVNLSDGLVLPIAI